MKRGADVGYANAAGGKTALRRLRETFGAGSEAEALRLALIAMVEGHERLLAVMPAGSVARKLAEGSFGSAPRLARMLVEGK